MFSRRKPRGDPMNAHDHLPILAWAQISESSAGRAFAKRLHRELSIRQSSSHGIQKRINLPRVVGEWGNGQPPAPAEAQILPTSKWTY